ncbi:hypothetical protein IKF34_00070 [Candidatus Saccharibacteria bacterium]|nr:hypothetical protein [Candidatus Saccharibacteria bacterium]
MDNGQLTPNNTNPFFTDGVGNAPETVNSDINNSLNDEAYQHAITPTEHDMRAMGNVANDIAAGGNSDPLDQESTAHEDQPGIGEIIDIGMPPLEPELAEGQPKSVSDVEEANPANFRGQNNRISKKTLKGTLRTIGKFSSNKISPSELVSFKNEATMNYLNNTYGENSHWKGKAA